LQPSAPRPVTSLGPPSSGVAGARAPQPAYEVVAVTAVLRENAAARLVAASSTDKSAARRFLDAARKHSIDLTHFYASLSRSGGAGRVREVCLAVPGSGRTAMFFLSNPSGETEQQELGQVVRRTVDSLRGPTLAQALLETDEGGARAGLLHAGFRRLDELIYLRRPRPAPREFDTGALVAALPPGVELRAWSQGDDDDVVEALDKSYAGTLDCPELCGLRDTRDVLASHRNTGAWDPRYWWIIRDRGSPEGMMLFNPCPEQDSIELVYCGLSPGLRGRGLGLLLMRIGLGSLSARPEACVACAVDARNTPARRMYEKLGFSEFDRRTALIHPIAKA